MAWYNKAAMIEAKVQVSHNHGGFVQFRICNADGLNNDPEMQCFERNVLKFENGKSEMELAKGRRRGVYHIFNVQLPLDLTCDHCVFQVETFQGL